MRQVLVAVLVTAAAMANPPAAQAYPPGFPDLETFTAVDPAQFTSSYFAGRGGTITDVGFRTPDGIYCGWTRVDNPAYHPDFTCTGSIPGVPGYVDQRDEPGCTRIAMGESLAGSAPIYAFTHMAHNSGSCPSVTAGAANRVLTPGHKLTSTNITCAVAEGNVTACIDPIVNRGFVLTPAGSWTF